MDDPVPWDPWHPPYSYPPILPDTDCVEARVNEYGHFKNFNKPIVYESEWGFVKGTGSGKEYYTSHWSKVQPPEYKWMLGRYTPHFPNPTDGGVVQIYRGAYDPNWNQTSAALEYTDPETLQQLVLHGPIKPDEMLTIVLEHEFGHAAFSQKLEEVLTGYGVEALKAYRNDPNADPCH